MEAIMITDAEQKIIVVNQAYTTITGYGSEEVIGLTPTLHRSGRHDEAFYQKLWHTLAQDGQWQGEIWNMATSATTSRSFPISVALNKPKPA